MYKVFVSRQLPEKILRFLQESGFVVDVHESESPIDRAILLEKSRDISGLLCTLNDSIDRDYLNTAKKLKVISTLSVGYDHIDVSLAKKNNIKIGYTPGVLTDATAELAVGLLLSVSRRLVEGVSTVKDGSWKSWSPYWHCGYGLKNSTVGIVGLGNIGKAIATRLQSFGVKYFFASSSNSSKYNTAVEITPNLLIKIVDLSTLLINSDFVIGSCTFNDKTKYLFNESTFSKMKSNAIFVNISRGGVVDQEALFNVLKAGKIAGAGLDVCTPEPLPIDHPLLSLKNCVVLPHLGSATIDTRNAMWDLAASNLVNGLLGKNMEAEL